MAFRVTAEAVLAIPRLPTATKPHQELRLIKRVWFEIMHTSPAPAVVDDGFFVAVEHLMNGVDVMGGADEIQAEITRG